MLSIESAEHLKRLSVDVMTHTPQSYHVAVDHDGTIVAPHGLIPKEMYRSAIHAFGPQTYMGLLLPPHIIRAATMPTPHIESLSLAAREDRWYLRLRGSELIRHAQTVHVGVVCGRVIFSQAANGQVFALRDADMPELCEKLDIYARPQHS